MVQLSDEQVDFIIQQIAADPITHKGLQNELLDHYCCFIENEMSSGSDFSTAYSRAFNAITPGGMQEIEEELFFLINLNTQINMKRIIYGSGFVAAFAITTGLMFRTMHWPYSSALTSTGFFALIISSIAILIKSRKFSKNHSSMYNVRVAVGMVSALLISTGSIFKALYFPFANIQIVVGMSLLSFVFIPMFFYYMYKQSLAMK